MTLSVAFVKYESIHHESYHYTSNNNTGIIPQPDPMHILGLVAAKEITLSVLDIFMPVYTALRKTFHNILNKGLQVKKGSRQITEKALLTIVVHHQFVCDRRRCCPYPKTGTSIDSPFKP